MTLNILTPTLSRTGLEVSEVFLPGSSGQFEVLCNHAPLLSSLDEGFIIWKGDEGEDRMAVKSGFVEVKDNIITVVAQI